MKHLLLTTIAAVGLVGCGESASERALLEAARDGNLEAVKQHLAAGTDVNAKSEKHGYTPLHFAAMRGRKEIGKLLIGEGADVNAKLKGGGGWTPLHFAAAFGHKEIVELLIANGADVNVKSFKRGVTPLDRAERVWGWESSEKKAARKETAALLRKHGGKTGEELKAEGK